MDSQLYCERHLTDAAQNSSKNEERIDEKVSELGDQVIPAWRHAVVANEMGPTLVRGRRSEVFVDRVFEKTMQLRCGAFTVSAHRSFGMYGCSNIITYGVLWHTIVHVHVGLSLK